MAHQSEHLCPECGTPRGADNTPSCACGERAAEALRDARTAEQAAAEDFDPLRIRPYVALHPEPAAPESPESATEPTLHDPAEPAAPARTGLPALPHGLTAPEAPEPAREPDPERHPEHRPEPDARPRRRRTVLLATTAILAVAATAGFAGGLFSYDPPTRDGAAPESVREAVPQAGTTTPTPTASATPPSTTSTTRSPSPTPTSTPTPTASRSTSPATPTPSPTPTGPPPSPTTPATGSPTPSDRGEPPATLRRGDSGPEVTELQLRLRQLYLYNGTPHGDYTGEVENAVRTYQWARGIRTDELGVYDEETRQTLESETSEP